MMIFLSWSGERSKAVAEGFASWISQVIQAAEPWISRDIAKGARWGSEVSERLSSSKVGLVCLTPENLVSPWILFEAGALSKTPDAYVCTLLLDLKPADVEEPLAQFQHTVPTKEDMRRLIETINETVRRAGEKALADHVLGEVFDIYWPRLEDKLTMIRDLSPAGTEPARSERELLEESLEILRRQERRFAEIDRLPTWKGIRESALTRAMYQRTAELLAGRSFTEDELRRRLVEEFLTNPASDVKTKPRAEGTDESGKSDADTSR